MCVFSNNDVHIDKKAGPSHIQPSRSTDELQNKAETVCEKVLVLDEKKITKI